MPATRSVDGDLDRMTDERLLKEVAFLTDKIDQVKAWRLRRVRAMRVLRSRKIDRPRIAAVARMTPGAVRNLIDALDRQENESA